MTKEVVFKETGQKNLAVAHYTEFMNDQDLQRIKAKNEKMSLRHRLRPLRKFIGIALIMLLLWSATTESFFLLSGFLGLTQNWWLSGIISLLLLLLIESGKYFLGSFVVRFIAQSWLRDGALYVISFLLLLPVAIALFLGSWFMSVEGSPYVSKFLQDINQTHVALISIDSIHEQFEAKHDSIKPLLLSAQSMTWNGKVTKKGAELALSVQQQINTLETRRDTTLAIAHRQNQILLQQAKQDRIDWASWLSNFGGVGELLTILFLIFIEYYDRASYLELPNRKPTPTPSNPNDSNNDTPSQAEEPLQHDAIRASKTSATNDTVNQNATEAGSTVEPCFEPEIAAIENNDSRNKNGAYSVDVRYTKQRVKQCYLRSLQQQSDAARKRNKNRMDEYIQQLLGLGIHTILNPNEPCEVLFVESSHFKNEAAA